MADEIKVEETTEQNATVETTEEEVDYDKELEEAMQKAQNKTFAEQRLASKESKPTEEIDVDLADKVAEKLLPKLQAINELNNQSAKLDAVSGNNPSKRALIEFHLKNSVNPNLDFETKLENAVAITNKRALAKTEKEINISLQNRSQISNSGLGVNTEVQQRPGANQVSSSQMSEIEKRANLMASAFTGSPEAKARVKANFIKNASDALARR